MGHQQLRQILVAARGGGLLLGLDQLLGDQLGRRRIGVSGLGTELRASGTAGEDECKRGRTACDKNAQTQNFCW